MTTLLIDGDICLYTASVATEFTCNWGDDNWVLSANLAQSKDIASIFIKGLEDDLQATQTIICLSGKHNFRKDLYPDYKANRKETRKPIIYNELKAWITDQYDVRIEENLEADDLLGILATSLEDTIVVSADKDLQCVPGRLYRKGELLTITLEEANRFHMLQTLTGDPTDGYPGCKGVGPVGATKALQGAPEGHWGAVVALYEKQGLTEDDALLNARMAYMLRAHNYDFKTKEITHWTPEIIPPTP